MALQGLESYLTAIEEEMRVALAVPDEALAPYYGMMHYHLGWTDDSFSSLGGKSGKRLRPLLCLLSCNAAGGDWHRALPAAVALELTHNFSLIHDDIEDNSPERRHRPTVWSLWGRAHGINTGDGLFVISRLALHRLLEQGVPATTVALAFNILDEACLKLTEGQYLDLAFEAEETVTVQMYLNMISKKTAALIDSATHLGALLATEDRETVENYRLFGHQLGLSFQIVDDVLGIWGEQDVTGKGVGEDIVSKKKSLPVVYALEQGHGEVREIYAQETIAPDQVATVVRALDKLGAREYAEALARQHWRLALDSLEKTGNHNEGQDRLRDLAVFLIERKD
jgi:geranylgeranyl diphosphate synthase type I